MEIRSYRSVFALERRIYQVDRLRLNPSGVPLRGVLYWLALTAAVVLARRLPLLGAVLGLLPWYLLELAIPAGAAAALAMIRVEGRPFHLAAAAVLRFARGPRRLCEMSPCAGHCGCWRPPRLLVLPDGSEGRPRRVLYRGPGAVRIAVAHERGLRRTALGRRELVVRPLVGRRAPAGARVASAGRRAAPTSVHGVSARAQVVVLGRGARLRVG